MQLHDKCDLKRVAKNTHGYVGAGKFTLGLEAIYSIYSILVQCILFYVEWCTRKP